MRRNLARGAIVGLGTIALVAACANSERQSAPTASEPASTATEAQPTASAVPPVFPTAPPPSPVVVPPEEPSPRPQATGTAHQAAPPPPPKAAAPAVEPANKPKSRADDEGRHATPAPNLGVKKVAVLANNHYTCSSTEKRDNVAAVAEPRGARIAIVGQGPCPGEVHDWSAQVSQQRVEVHGTHGAPSKCRCVGTGELVLRGLEPGTYEIAVNGGFDRPIATRITVLQ